MATHFKTNHDDSSGGSKHLRALMIGAIGVVYGDIGTSPLYALKSCFLIGDLPVVPLNILGLISLFLWSLFCVVTLKYVNLVMPVDHGGEGGILALSARCISLRIKRLRGLPLILGLVGMALFFGDCIITPAISVLSAVEGVKLISPHLSAYIMPLSIVVIILLFSIQRRGSGHIGQYFGIIMILWFLTIAILGLLAIMKTPLILKAFNPYYAFHFLFTHGRVGLLTMGGVILVFTGAEALYADMGHFGMRAIRLCWNYFIFPALVLNYLGQGALLLSQPEAITNPFYLLMPPSYISPLVILSTLATIIASQAVISGIFSLGWQAIMLNYLPRMRVIHTSSKQIGQVYLPAINGILCTLTIAAILLFKTSDNLAAAYGLSVSGIMIITSFLIFIHAMYALKWSQCKLLLAFIPLFLLDSLFLITSFAKLLDGAWCTILVTLIVFYLLHIWIKGNHTLDQQKNNLTIHAQTFFKTHAERYVSRIPGTAIFFSRIPQTIPRSLLIHVQHNKFLHEKVLLISIITENVPKVPTVKRLVFEELHDGVYQLTARFGFKEIPDVHKIIKWASYDKGLITHGAEVCFFISSSILVVMKHSPKKAIEAHIFKALSALSQNATEFYRIPHNKVIELGMHYKV